MKIVGVPDDKLDEIEGIEGIETFEPPNDDPYMDHPVSTLVLKKETEYGPCRVVMWLDGDNFGGRVGTEGHEWGPDSGYDPYVRWVINNIPITFSAMWQEQGDEVRVYVKANDTRRLDKPLYSDDGERNEATRNQRDKIRQAIIPVIETVLNDERNREKVRIIWRNYDIFAIEREMAKDAEELSQKAEELLNKREEYRKMMEGA